MTNPHTAHQRQVSPFRLLLISVLAVGCPGVVAAPAAHAADPGTVSVSGSTLEVIAPPGAKDNLEITRPSLPRMRVTDFPYGPYSGAPIHAGASCAQTGTNQVSCVATGIKLIDVSSGDLPDKVSNSTGIPSTINGGAANDTLFGGSARDTLVGGRGPDALKGMDGNDLLRARDDASDDLIDCGAGAGDRAELDPLPSDSDLNVKGCETSTRSTPKPGPYVALGDSLSVGFGASSPDKGYVRLLYSAYQSSLGADQLLNVGQSGATSTALRTGGQLASALADINAPSDTKAVTLDIGGNDLFLDPDACPGHWNQPNVCPFRTNFADILAQLKAALDHDPGIESFITMAYYNPGGLTVPVQASRAQIDQALLGSNLAVGCSDTGAKVGLNDIIYQEAGKLRIPVADPYPAFEQHSYISPTDPFHIHPGDAGYAAIAQAFGTATTLCGT